jgi:hypothetical protein
LGDINSVPTEPHHDAAGLFVWRGRLADELLSLMPQGLDDEHAHHAVVGGISLP